MQMYNEHTATPWSQVSELRMNNTSKSTSLPPWEEASPEYSTYTPHKHLSFSSPEIDSCILALEEQLPSPYKSLYHVSIASVSNEGSAVSDTQVEFATEGCWRVCFWYTRT